MRTSLGFILTALVVLGTSSAARAVSEFDRPWRSPNTSLVIDGYVFTEFDWSKLTKNERLVGFINKASDGLITSAACGRGNRAKRELCWAKWRRYVATREVYNTRKILAKKLGFKWGSYHLGRPGNPIRQAQHYLEYADPGPDDLMALDIEDNNSKWMSLDDAEIFLAFVGRKMGRLPVLYTNHSTAKAIAAQPWRWPTLAKVNLWYARYKANTTGTFPMGHWKSYTMWQFAAQVNCRRNSCPMRLHGTDRRIDINVVNLPPDELRKAWPLSEPFAYRDLPRPKRELEGEGPRPLLMARRVIEVPMGEAPDAESAVTLAFAPQGDARTVSTFDPVLRKPGTVRIELPTRIIAPSLRPAATVEPVPPLPLAMVREAKGAWAPPVRRPATASELWPKKARDPIYALDAAGLLTLDSLGR